MIYCTMCIGSKWVDVFKSSINRFANNNELYVLTDIPEEFDNCNTVLYERETFSYYDKLPFLFNISKSINERVTYIDANNIRNFNPNILVDDTSLYSGQLLDWKDMDMFRTDSTEKDVLKILSSIGVDKLYDKYVREHIISIPTSIFIDYIIDDIKQLQPLFEDYFDSVPKTPAMERYTKNGIGYAEGFELQAIAMKYSMEIKQMKYKAKSSKLNLI